MKSTLVVAASDAFTKGLFFLAQRKLLYIITVYLESAMSRRVICPHCHNSIDPLLLEVAVSARFQYRICPECDEPVVWLEDRAGEGDALSGDGLSLEPERVAA